MTPEDVRIERICMQAASWFAMASDYRKLKRPLSAAERAELAILVDEMNMLAAAIASLLGSGAASRGH